MNISALTEAEIRASSYVEDLDAALIPLMDKAGITSGDIAGLVLDHDNWRESDPPFRLDMLRNWLTTESLYHGVPQADVKAALAATKVADAIAPAAKIDSRDKELALIWRNTHRDFRGVIGGHKCILILREGGTHSVPLTELTEAEIASKLRYARKQGGAA